MGVAWTIYFNFCSPFLRRLNLNLALFGHAVSEEKTFEIVNDNDDNDNDDGRRGMGIV